MSNLIKYLIPLLGNTQEITKDGRKETVVDERLNLYLWMISDDVTRSNKYAEHGDGSSWANTPAKQAAYLSLKNTDRDPEIDVLINDFAKRIQNLKKSGVITNLNNLVNNLAGNQLDYTAKFIIDRIFATINGNIPTVNLPSPINDYEIYDVDVIISKFNSMNLYSGLIKNSPLDIFINECHNRRPLAFSYQIDEYLARRILQDVSTSNIPVGSNFLKDLDSLLTAPTHEFYRKPEDLSKLYTKEKDASGKEVEVEVQRGSQKTKDVTKDDTDCRGTQVNPDKTLTCHKYLEECLNGNGIDQCRDFMRNKNFWGNADGSAKNEVKGMLPAIALATLEKFGFRQINVFDNVAKKNIFKVESVNSWLENLAKTITDKTEYNAIKNNENLIKYLTLLEVKINTSPEILNKGITSSDDTQAFNPNKFAGQFAAQLGIKAKIPLASVIGPYKRFSNTLSMYGVNGSNIALSKLIPVRVSGVMVGGDVSDYVSKLDENYRFASVEFENQYKSYKNVLNSAGKTIDPIDDKSLTDLIENFKKNEKKIIISLRLIQKYIELLNVFKNNDPKGVLTLSNLDLLVSTNKNLLEKGAKKQENLVNALNTLASVVNNTLNVNSSNGNVSEVLQSGTFSHDN